MSKIIFERDYNDYRGKMRLGLCCINTVLRAQKPPVFCSRTMTRKNFTVELAKERGLENVKDIAKMIEWNEKHNIKILRLSSDIFPHFTDTETEKYDIDFARPYLKQAGELAKRYGHRIVMHPGQYNQVGSHSESTFQKTVDDLSNHADILDAMDVGLDGVLIVHGGGTYGDKEETIKRWVKQFHRLPEKVKKRLAIEHCERQYNLEDVIRISKECHIPVIYDSHHYSCYKKLHPEIKVKNQVDLFEDVIASWKGRNCNPLVHISEQGCGKIGHHSDYIDDLAEEFFFVIDKYGVCLDIEVEAKMKEQAILKIYEKYPQIFT